MKKLWLALPLILVLLLLAPACKKKAGAPAGGDDLLAMLPEGPVMVMAFDFQRFATLSFFDKALKENFQKGARAQAGAAFKDYQDFVQQTGIDLQKDVHAVVAAVYGSFEDKNPDALGVVSLTYDEAKLLAALRKQGGIAAEESYGGLTLYALKGDDKGREMRLAFLNKNCIQAGSAGPLKRAVDLAAKKGKSVLKSPEMMKYVNQVDKKNMFWLALAAIPGKAKQAPAGGMMPIDLSKAEAFTAVADFKDKVLSGELRLISPNEAGNKQIADMLNGLKAMAAMGAAKEPELGQLLNGLQLDSTADHVRLTFRLPEDLLNKLGEKAKSKAQGMMAPAMPGAAEPSYE